MNIFQNSWNWFVDLFQPTPTVLPPDPVAPPAPVVVPPAPIVPPKPAPVVVPPAPIVPPKPAPVVPAPVPVILPAPSASFDVSVLYVLKNEGGYVNNSADKGGPTNFGITQATYSAFKGRQVSAAEIKAMPLSDAKTIYKNNYWTPALEQLDQGVATCILDWSVLHGTHNGRQLAQTTCTALGVSCVADGVIGPASIKAINSIAPKNWIAQYEREVKAYFAGLVARNPSQSVFLNGWNNRANEMATLT